MSSKKEQLDIGSLQMEGFTNDAFLDQDTVRSSNSKHSLLCFTMRLEHLIISKFYSNLIYIAGLQCKSLSFWVRVVFDMISKPYFFRRSELNPLALLSFDYANTFDLEIW